jgi:hypothetical protein
MAAKPLRPSAMIKQRVKSTPVAMPKKSTAIGKPAPLVIKITPPGRKVAKPKGKPKGLNDFLKEGKRPPSKNKKLPSEADAIIKGYNDKKTLTRKKK